MPRRAHCVFHPVKQAREVVQQCNDNVSMPRRAHCVFHLKNQNPNDNIERPFQCPEGLIVYFTGSGCLKPPPSIRWCVSMPRRAHCVFHRRKLKWRKLKLKYLRFNAPKGSLCISPRAHDLAYEAASSFNAPKGSLCISPLSRVAARSGWKLSSRSFNAPKGSLCISPGVSCPWS